MAEASATAEGELARTPLAHLLVYALDRRLTGALFLSPPAGEEHVVRLSRGVPVKVRPGDKFSPLGEMLVSAGAIDMKTLEAALETKGLLGDVLLLAGRVERDVLEKVAEEQFRKRMVRFFALPPETTYRYYDEHEELAEYGGDPACVDPLTLLWAGLRTHGDISVMMEGTLARLGDTPLRLHPAATVSRFGLDAEESKLCDEIAAKPMSLAELCAASFPGLARRLVYALAITRQLELGTGLLPLGAEPVPSSSRRDLPQQPGTAVAKMALRSTVHRVGAAAPDAPGDGERGAPVAIPSRRSKDRGANASSNDLEPVSAVEAVTAPESGVVEVTAAAPQEPPLEASPPEEASSPVPAPAPALVPETQQATEAAPVESETLRSAEDMVASDVRRASAPDLEPAKDGHGYEGLSPQEIFWVASECLAERDLEGAVEACEAGRKDAPDDPDLISLAAWARAQLGGADIKALAVQLDEVLGAHEAHVEARYYRGMLRKRLGDEAGSLRDLQHVLELSPEHEGANLALAAVEQRQKKKERPSLFGKLFKR